MPMMENRAWDNRVLAVTLEVTSLQSSSDEPDLESMAGDTESDPFNIVPRLEWRDSAGTS
jgi:hypothetical protein